MAKFRAHARGYRIGIWALRFEKGCIEMPLHRPGIKVDFALEYFGIKRSMLWRRIGQQQSLGRKRTLQYTSDHAVCGAKPKFANEWQQFTEFKGIMAPRKLPRRVQREGFSQAPARQA